MSKPTSGLAALAPEIPKGRNNRCSIAILMEKLDDADRDYLVTLFADPDRDHAWIARLITAYTKQKVNGNTIGRHRNGSCSC